MTDEPKFNFSKAIADIEKINQWFQNEEIDLDEGLEKFRNGLELIKKCKSRLKEVENEFADIKKQYSMDKTPIDIIEKQVSEEVEPQKKVNPSSNIPF